MYDADHEYIIVGYPEQGRFPAYLFLLLEGISTAVRYILAQYSE